MEPTIRCGKHLAEHTNISESRFHDVNLSGAEFDDVNMSKVSFHNINFSNISICGVQMGGAQFKHIGLPPGTPGKQLPMRFEECDLNGSSFKKCDLTNVDVVDCDISGMKIHGILVQDMLDVYQQEHG